MKKDKTNKKKLQDTPEQGKLTIVTSFIKFGKDMGTFNSISTRFNKI